MRATARITLVTILTFCGSAVLFSSDAFAHVVPTAETLRAAQPCVTPADPVILASLSQAKDLLIGTWVRCDGESLFAGQIGADIGLEVVPDGRFFRLYRGAGDTLIRAEGLEQEGRWTVLDSTAINGPGSYQVNLRLLGSGTRIIQPTFLSSPSTLSALGMEIHAVHQRWAGAAPIPGRSEGIGDGTCGQPTNPVVLSSAAQVKQLLVGTWILCNGRSVAGGTIDGEAGLEIKGNGQFTLLVRGADGGSLRATDSGAQGTWDVLDTSAMNGPGFYQVNFVSSGSEAPFSAAFAAFFQSPEFVRFVGFQNNADYLKVDQLPTTGTGSMLVVAAAGLLLVLIGLALSPPAVWRRCGPPCGRSG
jgi:hypothetical protein